MRTPISSVVAVATAALLAGCGTTQPLHRGATQPAIHDVMTRLLVGDGYDCKPSADRSWVDCVHPTEPNVSFAYMSLSNTLTVFTTFSRLDTDIDARWRADTCAGVVDEVKAINDETIVKFGCHPKTLNFEMLTWVPDAGLSDDDLHGFVGVFVASVAEVISTRGLLAKPGAPEAAPVETAPAAEM